MHQVQIYQRYCSWSCISAFFNRNIYIEYQSDAIKKSHASDMQLNQSSQGHGALSNVYTLYHGLASQSVTNSSRYITI